MTTVVHPVPPLLRLLPAGVLLLIAVFIPSPAGAQWRAPGDTALFAAVRRLSPEFAARRAAEVEEAATAGASAAAGGAPDLA